MTSPANFQPLKTNLFPSTTGVLQKDISVTKYIFYEPYSKQEAQI